MRHLGWVCGTKSGLLTCRGFVQPTPISKPYYARIEYRIGLSPRTFIEQPTLESRDPNEAIPHVYGPNQPCVFHPAFGEWDSGYWLVRQVVPWLALWLLFYEIWLATGEWCGGGSHPMRPKRATRDGAENN